MTEDELSEDESGGFYPEPIEAECDNCGASYIDYWCELCGYHGHECEGYNVLSD